MVDLKIQKDSALSQKISELWLQYLWKESDFTGEELFTEDGESLEILFPGWYNRGWGPDFKESRVKIGGRLFFGDIEIHIEESAWQQHAHHQDEAYNKVILHVFLQKAKTPPINHFGQPISSLHLTSEKMLPFWENGPSPFETRIDEIPGACGLLLNHEKIAKLKKIIFQASENRLIAKAKAYEEQMIEGRDENDCLYTGICKSLGYSGYSEQFVMMSQRYPYSKTAPFFERLYRQSRIELLSRWFGCLGYLENFKIDSIGMEFRREWMSLKSRWEELCDEDEAILSRGSLKASRPFNHPLRRLVGLYYHLDKIKFQGLLKSWLRYLHECEQDLENGKTAKKRILDRLDNLFPQPSWEPLTRFSSPTATNPVQHNETRLIGKHRQRIILVNSVIPFFFAWARLNENKELEKLLFALLLILPGEGKNRVTSFMEARLALGRYPIKFHRNLSYHQGLIQIYHDCCTSFYEGCDQCTLLSMLG